MLSTVICNKPRVKFLAGWADESTAKREQ